jgi:Bacteriophage holin of superfamily 6 (Holin_LLH)
MNETFVPFVNILLMEVAKTVVPLLAVALFGLIVRGVAEFRKAAGEAKWAELMKWLDTAVKAAEQAGLNAALKNMAFEKKKFVMDFLTRKATELGLGGLAIEDLSLLVEKTVYEKFNAPFEVEPFQAKLEVSEPTPLWETFPGINGDPNAKG